jgi:hypothetical protein
MIQMILGHHLSQLSPITRKRLLSTSAEKRLQVYPEYNLNGLQISTTLTSNFVLWQMLQWDNTVKTVLDLCMNSAALLY